MKCHVFRCSASGYGLVQGEAAAPSQQQTKLTLAEMFGRNSVKGDKVKRQNNVMAGWVGCVFLWPTQDYPDGAGAASFAFVDQRWAIYLKWRINWVPICRSLSGVQSKGPSPPPPPPQTEISAVMTFEIISTRLGLRDNTAAGEHRSVRLSKTTCVAAGFSTAKVEFHEMYLVSECSSLRRTGLLGI